MSNAFKDAANKQKKQAGGLPAELAAGREETQVTPPVAQESPAPAPIPAPVAPAAPVAPVVEDPVDTGLVATYDAQKRVQEPRSVRFQAVITQSVNDKLNELANTGKIKSRNDLVNFLLERYLDEIE